MRKTGPKAQGGATLLEIILVLGISGMIFVLGIKMYQSFQNTLQLQELKYNVDQLFEAASNYFRANCATGTISPTPPVFLSPYPVSMQRGSWGYPPIQGDYGPISIALLQANGYLDNWQPSNPVVDPSGGDSGYVVQLNAIVSTAPIPVNACVVTTVGSTCLPITTANIASPNTAYSGAPSTTISTAQALIVTFAVQVAVKIQPQSKIAAYAAMLGADCTSFISGGAPAWVASCAAVGTGSNNYPYLVWSRIPSAALQKGSVFSSSMQLLKQYNLMYSHDQNYEMNSGYSTTAYPAQAPAYYLCGG